MIKRYWLGLSRKAKWLIVWSAIYSVLAVFFLTNDALAYFETGVNGELWNTYGILIQVPWLLIISTPLWVRSLGHWVFRRNPSR
jgi:hypothetical protein